MSSPDAGSPPGGPAGPAVDTTQAPTPAPTVATTTMKVRTTTAGATMLMYYPWLTAAAVAAYATRAMWVKFRQMGVSAQKKHKKQNQLEKRQDGDQKESESECESEDEEEVAFVEQDEMPKPLQSEVEPHKRSIES